MKPILFAILMFFATSCRTSAKMKIDEAPDRNLNQATKLTVPQDRSDRPQISVQFFIQGLKDSDSIKLARAIEDQIHFFDSCINSQQKGEVIRLKAQISLMNGRVDRVDVVEMVPESLQFQNCFSDQIKKLAGLPQTQKLQGEIVLQTSTEAAPRLQGERLKFE